jgi:tetraacyldisaccharide 4'-kinase
MIKLVYPKFWSKRGILSLFLTPFSWIYQLLTILRQISASPIRLGAKVICIGNVSVGGTGKTQIVEYLALHYKKENKKILIITKGYGSSLKKAKLVASDDSAQEVGDESKLLSKFAPVIAATKIQYALPIIKTIKPEIIIFDDGLQNPNFVKDCKILVIDNKRGFGNGKIFPSGPLRETPNSAIKKCDAVIMIGDKDCSNFSVIQTIVNNKKPLFKAKINLVSEIKANVKYFAFSAIGNPDKFFDTLIQNGAQIAGTKAFPDHHQFSDQEILELKNTAKKHNFTLITTTKDYIKIANPENIQCAKVDIIFKNNKEFIKLIDETLS